MLDLLLAWLMGDSEERPERYRRLTARIGLLMVAAAFAAILILVFVRM